MSYDIHTLYSSDDEFPDLSSRALKLLNGKKTLVAGPETSKIMGMDYGPASDSSDIEEIIPEIVKPSTPKGLPAKFRNFNDEKLAKKGEMEAKKRSKEKAKADKEREKTLKQASKPGDCLKYIRVILDRRLIENTDGSQITSHLSTIGIKYRIEEQTVLNEIRFERLSLESEKEYTEEEVIIVVPLLHFIDLVYNEIYNKDKVSTLCYQCQKWKDNIGQKLTIVVMGIERYLKNNKTTNNRQYKEKVLNVTSPKKSKRLKKTPESNPEVSKCDIENALIAAEIEKNVNSRLLEGAEKLADFVTQIAKAIAERPYKETRSVGDFNFYADGVSNNAVKVDKMGIGLRRLWLQQLRQFNNVGVEVAQAIVREYGSPHDLFEAYNKSVNPDALLSDIPVRRGIGPLANTRKIGPEMSAKISDFFNSTNPTQILGQKQP